MPGESREGLTPSRDGNLQLDAHLYLPIAQVRQREVLYFDHPIFAISDGVLLVEDEPAIRDCSRDSQYDDEKVLTEGFEVLVGSSHDASYPARRTFARAL